MKTNIRVPLKPKHKASPPQVLSPQELSTTYKDLLITFSDPLTSATEIQLVDQLMESRENNKVRISADSYVEFYNFDNFFQNFIFTNFSSTHDIFGPGYP